MIKPPPGAPAAFDLNSWIRKVIPFTGRFIAGEKSGLGFWLTATFAAPNSDTTFIISNGMIPNIGYVVVQASAGGIVYNGSNQGSDWTANSIVLRATAAGTYKMWLS